MEAKVRKKQIFIKMEAKGKEIEARMKKKSFGLYSLQYSSNHKNMDTLYLQNILSKEVSKCYSLEN